MDCRLGGPIRARSFALFRRVRVATVHISRGGSVRRTARERRPASSCQRRRSRSLRRDHAELRSDRRLAGPRRERQPCCESVHASRSRAAGMEQPRGCLEQLRAAATTSPFLAPRATHFHCRASRRRACLRRGPRQCSFTRRCHAPVVDTTSCSYRIAPTAPTARQPSSSPSCGCRCRACRALASRSIQERRRARKLGVHFGSQRSAVRTTSRSRSVDTRRRLGRRRRALPLRVKAWAGSYGAWSFSSLDALQCRRRRSLRRRIRFRQRERSLVGGAVCRVRRRRSGKRTTRLSTHRRDASRHARDRFTCAVSAARRFDLRPAYRRDAAPPRRALTATRLHLGCVACRATAAFGAARGSSRRYPLAWAADGAVELRRRRPAALQSSLGRAPAAAAASPPTTAPRRRRAPAARPSRPHSPATSICSTKTCG